MLEYLSVHLAHWFLHNENKNRNFGMAHEIFIEIQPHYFPEFTLTINLITSITLKDRIESMNKNYLLSVY